MIYKHKMLKNYNIEFKKIAGLYIHVSTEDQAREEFRLPEQEKQKAEFNDNN